MSLSGKNLLITGGTSRLGSCLVRQASLAGARVFFTWHQNEAQARKLENLDAVAPGPHLPAGQAGSRRGCVRGIKLEMQSGEQVREAAKKILSATRILNGLIHNAAAIRDATLENLNEADWDAVMFANVKAPFLLTQGLMPALEKANPGRVVALTSRAAAAGVYGASNYAASKAALEAWVKTLARECGEKVLVNAVNPGFMLSGMTEKVPEKAKEMQKGLSPLKRFSDPESVAKVILFLLSDENTQITGQVLNLESRISWSSGSVLGAEGDGD